MRLQVLLDPPYLEAGRDPAIEAALLDRAAALAAAVGAPLYRAIRSSSPPAGCPSPPPPRPVDGEYPFPAVELEDVGGAGPYVYRDGRHLGGPIARVPPPAGAGGAGGGGAVVVGVLFGGW
jgi:hypothetical protein